MSSFSQVLQWFRDRDIAVSPQDMDFFERHTIVESLPRNSTLMQQGLPVQHFYFLNAGIARLFLKHQAADITVAFICAPQYASTINYLLNGMPSPLAIEACTDLQVLQWDKEDIIALKNHSELGYRWETAFTELLLAWNMERELDRLTRTPEERYDKLVQGFPEIAQQVPVKYIASYLGIHPDSLSRIRNRLVKRI